MNTVPWCPYETRQAFAHIPGTTHFQPLPLMEDGTPVHGVPPAYPGVLREPEHNALRHCQAPIGVTPLYLGYPRSFAGGCPHFWRPS